MDTAELSMELMSNKVIIKAVLKMTRGQAGAPCSTRKASRKKANGNMMNCRNLRKMIQKKKISGKNSLNRW